MSNLKYLTEDQELVRVVEKICEQVWETDKELMQQALSVLCNNVQPREGVRDNRHLTPKSHAEIYQQTIDALRGRVEQPEQEPLTHPQIHEFDWPDGVSFDDILSFVRVIEETHGIKEKNT